jgi:hypothetical protein
MATAPLRSLFVSYFALMFDVRKKNGVEKASSIYDSTYA